MSEDDLEEAVVEFLDASDNVYDEYDQGYVDADAALSMLTPHLETLRESVD